MFCWGIGFWTLFGLCNRMYWMYMQMYIVDFYVVLNIAPQSSADKQL